MGSTSKSKDDKPQHGTFFLGRYRVVDEIGVGGMASVHLGRMDGPGGFQKWVAIKRIHPHLVEDDQFVDMFLDEARIAAGINHANVAQVFDLGKDDNTYWIAMEYLHGEPLREIMRRVEEKGMRVPPEIAARLCSDAAEGLHAAHELRGKNGQLLGLVHRDVTPHNLFVTYEGYTKVVDFGIAKVADRLASTRAGTLKGKLAYMSPEQVRGLEVDRTTDIFALGVVLWELATNERLFRMDTDLDTLEKVQSCNVPPPSTRVRDFPPELEAVILKSLAKRKQDRYQTSREFSRALQGFLMRRGAFVGPEEVSQFVRNLFADRIQKREAHLAWAQEVTSTINVGQLQKSGAVDELSVVSYEEVDDRKKPTVARPAAVAPPPKAPAPAPPPAPPKAATVPLAQAQMAAQSLMDDDEDVPTTVATRDQLLPVGNAAAPRVAPKPAAGMPAAPPPQAYGGPSPGSAAQAVVATHRLERTIGLDEAEQLGMLGGPSGPAPAPAPQAYGAYASGTGPQAPSVQVNLAPSFGAAPAAPSFGAAPAAPSFGAPAAPSFGAPATPSFGAPVSAIPQSQIETAMSLPRPDPSVLRIAQQPKRNVGLLAAVVALTALCVFGIGMIIYFKVLSKPPEGPAADAPSAPAPAKSSAAIQPAKAPDPPAASTAPAAAPPTAPATAQPALTAAAPAGTPVKPSGPAPQQPAATAQPKGETGTLIIACNPGCDEVSIGGRGYGKPPVRATLPVGQHRVTGKYNGKSKTVSIVVTGGATTSQTLNFK